MYVYLYVFIHTHSVYWNNDAVSLQAGMETKITFSG